MQIVTMTVNVLARWASDWALLSKPFMPGHRLGILQWTSTGGKIARILEGISLLLSLIWYFLVLHVILWYILIFGRMSLVVSKMSTNYDCILKVDK